MLALALRAFNLVLPPLCLKCQALVGEHGSLCKSCWDEINFISQPCCPKCGSGFELAMPAGTYCAQCLDVSPPWDQGRAVFRYDEASKPLILAFKHADRLDMAPALAKWLYRAGADFWPQTDVIIPVPLHRWRLFQRRFNQAGVLAHHLGKLASKPVNVTGLRRLRATKSQGHASAAARRRNVSGAFGCTAKFAQQIQGKNVVLVDDVLTTGATLAACTQALRKAGAKTVQILVLGRVPADK